MKRGKSAQAAMAAGVLVKIQDSKIASDQMVGPPRSIRAGADQNGVSRCTGRPAGAFSGAGRYQTLGVVQIASMSLPR